MIGFIVTEGMVYTPELGNGEIGDNLDHNLSPYRKDIELISGNAHIRRNPKLKTSVQFENFLGI